MSHSEPGAAPARPLVSTRPQTDPKASRCGRSQRIFGELYAVLGQYLDSGLDIGVGSEGHGRRTEPAR